MPRIRTVGPEARGRVVGRGSSRAYQERAPFREAIANLAGDATLEIEAEPGENLRQLKSRARRAASELGRQIQYGETLEGTLLVWLAEQPRRRGRRPRQQSAVSDTQSKNTLPESEDQA